MDPNSAMGWRSKCGEATRPKCKRPGQKANRASESQIVSRRLVLPVVLRTRDTGENALLCSSPAQSLHRHRNAAAPCTLPSRSSTAARLSSHCGLSYARAAISISVGTRSSVIQFVWHHGGCQYWRRQRQRPVLPVRGAGASANWPREFCFATAADHWACCAKAGRVGLRLLSLQVQDAEAAGTGAYT